MPRPSISRPAPTMPFPFQTVLLAALFAGQRLFSVAAPANPLDVSLTTGTFRGVLTANGTEKWLGIRFAEPPVGRLRFMPPVPVTQMAKGTQDASSFGNACPQLPGTLGAPVAEDCLFLNVRQRYLLESKPVSNTQGRSGGRRTPTLALNFRCCSGFTYEFLFS